MVECGGLLNTFDYKDRGFQRFSFISDLFWGPQKAVRLPPVPFVIWASPDLSWYKSQAHPMSLSTRNSGRQRLAMRNFLHQLPHGPQVAAKNFRLGFSILQGPIKGEGQPRDGSQDVSSGSQAENCEASRLATFITFTESGDSL